jgi:hypothetical protein
MPTTTNILKIEIPVLSDDANIEDATGPFAESFEQFVVTVFSNTSARSSALSSPALGMISYVQSTGNLEVYDGSGWIPIARTQAWTSFTPTITGPGVSKGNGVLTGRYQRVGRAVDVVMLLTFGTTTTIGTSKFSFGSLPFSTVATDFQAGVSWLYDDSTTSGFAAGALFEGTTHIRPVAATGGNVHNNNPFDFTTGDVICCQMRYEI